MACFHPRFAWKVPCANGKYKIYFAPPKDYYTPSWDERFGIRLPCGQCIGCRIDKSREWALRCVHEASLYDENYFVTLTYKPERLTSPSLQVRDLQLFCKRVRKNIGPFRFYAAGEYGSKRQRPHFHICMFGLHLSDLRMWSYRDGIRLYRSPEIESCWTAGFSTVGYVTFESAAYCARYCLKKLTGKRASEYGDLKPEFNLMSRRPGIGSAWFGKYHDECYFLDGRTMCRNHGVNFRLPRYYDNLMEQMDPDMMINCKSWRSKIAGQIDYTTASLAGKERCFQRRIDRLVRALEFSE